MNQNLQQHPKFLQTNPKIMGLELKEIIILFVFSFLLSFLGIKEEKNLFFSSLALISFIGIKKILPRGEILFWFNNLTRKKD